MPNDSKINTSNISNPSLTGSSSSTKNIGGNNAVDWLKKKTGTALKKVNRLEEKFNQAIGKAQRTEDEVFETNVHTFEEQSQTANLFYKELNKYIVGLRETQKNQKNFFECLKQVYETSWPGYNDLIQQCQKQEDLWTNHIDLLQQCVQVPINHYIKEFPECKKQVEKRDNKLLDYDKARHTLHDLETAKKPDEVRIHRARIDLTEKQKLFNDLNSELHLKLPKLYDDRKSVYSKSFKSLFNIEKTFYNNMYESKQILNDVCEKLIDEFNLSSNDEDNFELYKTNGNGNGNDSNSNSSNNNEINYDNCSSSVVDDEDKPSAYEFAVDTLNQNNQQINKPPFLHIKKSESNDINNQKQNQQQSQGSPSTSSTSSINSPKSNNKSAMVNSSTDFNGINNSNSTSNLYANIFNNALNNKNISPSTPPPIPSAPVSDNVQPKLSKVLYKVKATYPYQAKEIDELTFSKEDFIDVIEGTESEKEDLDDGWLIGIHCQTNTRGLFPENFTKRI